jgi:hypothetical protein
MLLGSDCIKDGMIRSSASMMVCDIAQVLLVYISSQIRFEKPLNLRPHPQPLSQAWERRFYVTGEPRDVKKRQDRGEPEPEAMAG